MPIFAVLFGLMVFPNEDMIEFRKHSNGNAYVLVDTVECEGGLRKSGYSHAPHGRVGIKQVNDDGSVSLPACDGALIK